MKRCTSCGIEKPLNQFSTYNKTQTWNGKTYGVYTYRRNQCKKCHRKQCRKKDSKIRTELKDSYIKTQLINRGFSDITPELIELKRIQLKLKRIWQQE